MKKFIAIEICVPDDYNEDAELSMLDAFMKYLHTNPLGVFFLTKGANIYRNIRIRELVTGRWEYTDEAK